MFNTRPRELEDDKWEQGCNIKFLVQNKVNDMLTAEYGEHVMK